jgi:serine phosphatase RsbU (regulator of sigma subunit)
MLLGPESPSTPGYAVQVVYRPARQVGGDFHQQIPGDDGSLLTVVGDVSGKGLPAAMLVSTVIGALADLPSRRPAEVLAHLNRALAGRARGGFVTCCAALIHREASVEIANAGHIPPWLGPKPLEMEGGLPLGLAPDVDYAQYSFPLDGQVLTMLSDGVIEARNAQGELFGFERTQAAIGQSAAQIAKRKRISGRTTTSWS